MAELPLITVITVCHNNADVVEQTIRSVLEQQYPRMNYIIWDGCSTDTTLDIVKRYDEQLTYWTSEPNNGTYDAMNRALLAPTSSGSSSSMQATDSLMRKFLPRSFRWRDWTLIV